MDFWGFLEILIFIVLLVIFFRYVLLRFVMPFCTGVWVAVRGVTDVALQPLHTIGRLFEKKPHSALPTVPPYWPTTPTAEEWLAQERKRKKEVRLAPWGGIKSIVCMTVCLAVILFTMLYIAVQPAQTTGNSFWEEFVFSIPALSLVKMVGAGANASDSFSFGALVELVLFNLLAVLFMRHPDGVHRDHVTLADVFRYNLADELETMKFRRTSEDAPTFVFVLIAALYNILFTLFCTCLLFWLPDDWYPSASVLSAQVPLLADSLVAHLGGFGYVVVVLLAVLVGYLTVAGLALLVREFVATIAFTVVPLVSMLLLYGVISAVFPMTTAVYTTLFILLAVLASVWQCFYRGHVEELYEDYRRTHSLIKKKPRNEVYPNQ